MGSPESPVYAYLTNPTMVDFSGHLAAVFFVSGCNFRCGFCHNPDLMRKKQKGISWEQLDAACRNFRKQWVDGAVITGGEPTLSEDLPELIDRLKSHGWAVKLDTNGSRPEMLNEVLPLVDYVAMDVKAGLSKYPELCGFEDTERIRRSMDVIRRKARDYEFRTTLIESFHSDEQVGEMGDLVSKSRRYVLQPFIPKEDLPDVTFRSLTRTSPDRLVEVRNRLAGCADEVLVRGEF